MNSFIGWKGGKRLLAGNIVDMIPSHVCYVEVFGGAGWVLFKKKKFKVEVFNDLDSNLINLFRVVRNNYEEFCSRQEFLLSSREEHDDFHNQLYNEGEFKDNIERAVVFYYLIKNSFANKPNDVFAYRKTQQPSYNNFNLKEKLFKIKRRLERVYIENKSYEDLIPRYDGENIVFYCDPDHYKRVTHYKHGFNQQDHELLFKILNDIKGKFILSYDNCNFIKNLYKNFNMYHTKQINYSAANNDNSTFGSELFITNFIPLNVDHLINL